MPRGGLGGQGTGGHGWTRWMRAVIVPARGENLRRMKGGKAALFRGRTGPAVDKPVSARSPDGAKRNPGAAEEVRDDPRIGIRATGSGARRVSPPLQ